MTGLLPNLPASLYHQDQVADQPTLSASIAHLLCTQSPAHVKAAHPRLNPSYVRQDEAKFDRGVCAHALLLEGNSAVAVVPYDDWRTKAAQEIRDQARADGLIPLLAKDWDGVQAMVDAARAQLVEHEAEPEPFTDGLPEQTIVWDEDGVTCRARLDWLHDDMRAVDDMKTSSRSANPESWTRSTLFSIGADVQAAFYLRGIRAVFGVEPAFRWVVVETAEPFALSVISPGPDVLLMANKKVDYALAKWRHCLADSSWPGYDRRVAYAELPPWEESRWLEKEVRESEGSAV